MNGKIQMVQATRHAVRCVWRCVDITAARWSCWLLSLTSWRAAVVVVVVLDFAARNLLAISCVVLSDLFASLSPPINTRAEKRARRIERYLSVPRSCTFLRASVAYRPGGFSVLPEGGRRCWVVLFIDKIQDRKQCKEYGQNKSKSQRNHDTG